MKIKMEWRRSERNQWRMGRVKRKDGGVKKRKGMTEEWKGRKNEGVEWKR